MTRAILVAVAVACAAGAIAAGAAARGDEPRASVGANVVVNPPRPIDASNSPTVAADPTRPSRLVVAYRVDRPRFSARLAVTDDGGRAWAPRELPLPEGKDRPFAPDVAFAPDGTLHAVYVNLEGRGNAPANLWVTRSSDGGRTFSDPVRVAAGYTFQPRIAVDREGTVHLTWLQATEVGILQLSGERNPIVAVRSTDGGRTFSDPVRVSDPSRPRVGAATPVVDGSGRLFVLYEDFKEDRRDFENLEGPPWEDPFALVLTRSDDGGRSFTKGVEIESGILPGRRFLVFLPEFPSIAATGDDLTVAWADARHGDEDVFLRRSTDGGATWSSVRRVNRNPTGDGTTQYLPRVATGEDGRVRVLFLDRRRDGADLLTDATLAWSNDGGDTFHETKVSTASFSSEVGPVTARHLGVDFGTRLGLHASGDRALAVWTDTRHGTLDTGRQDIVAAVVRLPRTRSPLAGWPASGALAMVAVGAAVAAVRSGRRGHGDDRAVEAHRPG